MTGSRAKVAAKRGNAPVLFIPGDGIMYRLHPFTKFLFVAIVSTTVLIVDSLILLGAVVIGLIVLVKANGLSAVASLRFFKWILILSTSLVPLDMLFNFLHVPGTEVVAVILPPFFPVRRFTLYIAARSVGWIACFSISNGLLVFTTKPRDFVTGLMEARMPQSLAFGISIGLRYVPMIQQEMSAIHIAQRVRGRSRSTVKGVRDALAYMKEQISTGLVAVFRHAFHTSISMEKRAFRLHKTRTITYRIGFTRMDAMFLALAIGSCVLLVCASFNLIPFLTVPSLYAAFFPS